MLQSHAVEQIIQSNLSQYWLLEPCRRLSVFWKKQEMFLNALFPHTWPLVWHLFWTQCHCVFFIHTCIAYSLSGAICTVSVLVKLSCCSNICKRSKQPSAHPLFVWNNTNPSKFSTTSGFFERLQHFTKKTRVFHNYYVGKLKFLLSNFNGIGQKELGVTFSFYWSCLNPTKTQKKRGFYSF